MTTVTAVRVGGLAGRSEPLVLDLKPDLNIIFGLNGSGKTSLLKIIYSALTNDPRYLANVRFTNAEVSFYSVKYKRELTRVFEREPVEGAGARYVVVESAEDEDSEEWVQVGESAVSRWVTSDPDAQQRFKSKFLSTSRLYSGRLPPTSERGATGALFGDQLDRRFAKDIAQLWRRYSNTMLQEVSGIQQRGLSDILGSIFADEAQHDSDEVAAEDASEAYSRAIAFMRRQGLRPKIKKDTFADRFESDVGVRRVVRLIDDIERRVADAQEPRNEITGLLNRFVSGGKHFEFTDTSIDITLGDGEDLDVAMLSSGEKHLLRILIDVIGQDQTAILIDEPELSMHVDWQCELVGAMQALSAGSQITLATHSPEIMAGVSDDHIFAI